MNLVNGQNDQLLKVAPLLAMIPDWVRLREKGCSFILMLDGEI